MILMVSLEMKFFNGRCEKKSGRLIKIVITELFSNFSLFLLVQYLSFFHLVSTFFILKSKSAVT